MSKSQSTELPFWMQDTETVLAIDEGAQWRGVTHPDYCHTNQFGEKESKDRHGQGTLNAIAHNLVKTCEMKASHTINLQQWLSLVPEKFPMSSNGGPEYTASDIAETGTDNLFLGDREHYRSSVVGVSVARFTEELKNESYVMARR